MNLHLVKHFLIMWDPIKTTWFHSVSTLSPLQTEPTKVEKHTIVKSWEGAERILKCGCVWGRHLSKGLP